VKFVSCDTAANKIDCLRKAPYEKIYTHMQTQRMWSTGETIPGSSLKILPTPANVFACLAYLIGYQSLSGPYTLRPGRPLLSQSPYDLASAGKMSKVPVLVGDMKDEGTLFSLINSLNTTTDEQVKDYLKTFWWPNATESQLDGLLVQYPVDKGAPYDAALSLPLLPQFGRIASITGDYSFEVSLEPSRIRSELVFESASLHGVDKSSRTHHIDIGPTPPSLEQPSRKALELPHHRPASRSRPGRTHRRPAHRFPRRPHGAPSPRLFPRR